MKYGLKYDSTEVAPQNEGIKYSKYACVYKIIITCQFLPFQSPFGQLLIILTMPTNSVKILLNPDFIY